MTPGCYAAKRPETRRPASPAGETDSVDINEVLLWASISRGFSGEFAIVVEVGPRRAEGYGRSRAEAAKPNEHRLARQFGPRSTWASRA